MQCSSVVICPGCGWTGKVSELSSGACPNKFCSYENDQEPYFRLLTIGEMMLADIGGAKWKDVDLPAYFQAFVAVLGLGRDVVSRQYGEEKKVTGLKVGDRVRFISGGYHIGEEAEVVEVSPPPWITVLLDGGTTKWMANENEVEKVVDERG